MDDALPLSNSISDLINFVSKTKAPKYITRNGKRIKFADYKELDSYDKADFDIKDDLNWGPIDLELNQLIDAWDREQSPIKRQILIIQYDLLIEGFVNDEPETIIKLRNKLNLLQTKLLE